MLPGHVVIDSLHLREQLASPTPQCFGPGYLNVFYDINEANAFFVQGTLTRGIRG